jgi:hypothetical protein
MRYAVEAAIVHRLPHPGSAGLPSSLLEETEDAIDQLIAGYFYCSVFSFKNLEVALLDYGIAIAIRFLEIRVCLRSPSFGSYRYRFAGSSSIAVT